MRLVPKFEDAFKETLVQLPTRLPDRRYLELYESPELNFIGRPFEDMARFHQNQLTVEGSMNFLKKEAHSKKTNLHDLAANLNAGPGGDPPPPPGGGYPTTPSAGRRFYTFFFNLYAFFWKFPKPFKHFNTFS